MDPPPGRRPELRELARLAGPLALYHLGNQMLGFVDSAIVGRYGAVELGAVGLGNAVFFSVAVVGLGLMLGLDPLVSQAVGAGERAGARRLFWQGMWMATALTPPLVVLILAAGATLPLVGIEGRTADITFEYLVPRALGLVFFLGGVGGRAYLQAHDITRPLILSVLLAHVVNLPVSWVLVFGDPALVAVGLPALGVAPMGAAGAGWGSAASSAVQCVVVLAAVGRMPSIVVSRRLDPALQRRALRLGVPIGLALLAEVGVFGLTTVLAGWLGARALAAHHVALTLASTTFQVALAVAIAGSVRVGQAVGRGDTVGTRRAGFAAIGSTGTYMLACAATFVLVPAPLARLLSDDPEVVAAALPLLRVAAAFQLADGVQVASAGALRGAGDTRPPVVANGVGHYLVGLPIGATLAFGARWGAEGLWWGLSVGLALVAVFLTLRFARVSRHPIERS